MDFFAVNGAIFRFVFLKASPNYLTDCEYDAAAIALPIKLNYNFIYSSFEYYFLVITP